MITRVFCLTFAMLITTLSVNAGALADYNFGADGYPFVPLPNTPYPISGQESFNSPIGGVHVGIDRHDKTINTIDKLTVQWSIDIVVLSYKNGCSRSGFGTAFFFQLQTHKPTGIVTPLVEGPIVYPMPSYAPPHWLSSNPNHFFPNPLPPVTGCHLSGVSKGNNTGSDTTCPPANAKKEEQSDDKSPEGPPEKSDGSVIDNLNFSYIHDAADYTSNPSYSSSCGSCSTSNSDIGALPRFSLLRYHRYDYLGYRSSFGPGVFNNFDISLRLSPGVIEFFDPTKRVAYDLTDSDANGVFTDERYQSIKELRLYDSGACKPLIFHLHAPRHS